MFLGIVVRIGADGKSKSIKTSYPFSQRTCFKAKNYFVLNDVVKKYLIILKELMAHTYKV